MYMPDINLHEGFEHCANIARSMMKRELTKQERNLLFKRYQRACNAHQLIVISQHIAPINLGGAVWFKTEGCKSKLVPLVEHKLGRNLGRRERNIINAQWGQLTQRNRVTGSDCSLGSLIRKGQEHRVSTGRTGGKNFSNMNTFDYGRAKHLLKQRLHNGQVTHAQYNQLLIALKEAKAQLIQQLKRQDNRHLDNWTYSVVHNARGLSSGSGTGSRYTDDMAATLAAEKARHNDTINHIKRANKVPVIVVTDTLNYKSNHTATIEEKKMQARYDAARNQDQLAAYENWLESRNAFNH